MSIYEKHKDVDGRTSDELSVLDVAPYGITVQRTVHCEADRFVEERIHLSYEQGTRLAHLIHSVMAQVKDEQDAKEQGDGE